MPSPIHVRPATEADWPWILVESVPLGGPRVVSNGMLHDLREHEGLVAWRDEERVGLAIYRAPAPDAELLALRAMVQWGGIGSALLEAFEQHARARGCVEAWITTTNDNVDALRFYQRRGYALKVLRAGEFRNILRMKGLDPDATFVGQHGIVIRDEIRLHKPLASPQPEGRDTAP